eukprot:1147229-Pelagomonas_calceolata.AAC.1
MHVDMYAHALRQNKSNLRLTAPKALGIWPHRCCGTPRYIGKGHQPAGGGHCGQAVARMETPLKATLKYLCMSLNGKKASSKWDRTIMGELQQGWGTSEGQSN